MKKFKSMKKRDEKMESLLMEKWGYSAPILNEDGDKELLQEAFVFLGLTGWAAYTVASALVLAAAAGGYGIWDSHTTRKGAAEMAETYGTDLKGHEKLNPVANPPQVSAEERAKLPPSNPVFPPGSGAPPQAKAVKADDGYYYPPQGFMWQDDDPDSDNWTVVPLPPGDDDDTVMLPSDVHSDPNQSQVFSATPTEIDLPDDDEPLPESVTRTKEIVKEEIIKYFSNRRKS